MAERFGLTEKQAEVLDRAAAALLAERDLSGRLGALVTVGEQARVGAGEEEFLRSAVEAVRPRSALSRSGWSPPAVPAVTGADVLPLTVKGKVAGGVRIPATGRPELRATLANQLSIGLENARLYGELSTLFRQYMSPDVAAALLADPDQAALGGQWST